MRRVKKPTPLSYQQERNKKKYCAYHESYKNNTYDYRLLKEEIESLIKEGKLIEWVVREVKKNKENTLDRRGIGKDDKKEEEDK